MNSLGNMAGLDTTDLAALGFFAAGWAVYHILQEASALSGASLNRRMDDYRFLWMRRMLTRDVRIVDTQIMASLQNGAAFFASTSLIAVGGALALLQSSGDMAQVFADLPFTRAAPKEAWEIKGLGLLILFVYAFYKFAWSYRMFNYAAIMLGAAPLHPDAQDKDAVAHADRTARLATVAGRHFNRGQRALFFSLAYLGWFVGPYVLVAATVLMIAVMARHQYGPEADFVLRP